MLQNISFVLSHTTHPGNIGAAARALKVMGLSKMRLVNPKDFPSQEATRRSSNAHEVLEAAQVYSNIKEAIADQALIIGTSARNRSFPWPLIEPRELAQKLAKEHSAKPVAFLFGTESSGLTNEELQLCHYHVWIPTNPDYSSLNLASAIQLIAYELRLAALESGLELDSSSHVIEPGDEFAESELVEQMLEHWFQVMEHTKFYDPQSPKLAELRFRRILNKAQLTRSEVQLLRGFLASVKKFDRSRNSLINSPQVSAKLEP